MSKSRRQTERNCKRRIARRLRPRNWEDQPNPMMSARNIHYEISERTRALGWDRCFPLARQVGLIKEIDGSFGLLKRHTPYHDSDHVLNIAYNLFSGGSCLEDLELLRSDDTYLDALGAQRIPDPTTAGDYCRRFDPRKVEALRSAVNRTRVRVWQKQPAGFIEEAAVIEADGTLAPTTGECKEGMDYSYKGEWGYHPLVVSLANTGDPLF